MSSDYVAKIQVKADAHPRIQQPYPLSAYDQMRLELHEDEEVAQGKAYWVTAGQSGEWASPSFVVDSAAKGSLAAQYVTTAGLIPRRWMYFGRRLQLTAYLKEPKREHYTLSWTVCGGLPRWQSMKILDVYCNWRPNEESCGRRCCILVQSRDRASFSPLWTTRFVGCGAPHCKRISCYCPHGLGGDGKSDQTSVD